MQNMASSLGKYLSPTVYDSIFKGEKEVEISSYRKMLTICFTDIVGFTSRSEKMDEKELTHWLNNYLNDMAHVSLSRQAGHWINSLVMR